MKNPKPRPKVILVPDGKGGTLEYHAQVFLIHTKNNGVPRLCTLIPDGGTIELAGGEEFMICYVAKKMLEENQ